MVNAIPADDVRHDLAAEVRVRLGQLDIILKHLSDARSVDHPDSQELKRVNIWAQENHSALLRGEITMEQWIDGTSLPRQVEPQRYLEYIEAWESIVLFTESFYFFAWRLMECLNNRSNQFRFPGLERIKADGVSDVRNHLLQHPENHFDGSENSRQRFKQGLVVTSSGPVLRTTEFAIKSATGEMIPTENTEDKGLDITARKFCDELQKRFDRAIKSLTSP